MEKHYEFDEKALEERLNVIINNIGPFVRAVNIANRDIHLNGEKLNYPNIVRDVHEAKLLGEEARDNTLPTVDAMIAELQELDERIKENLYKYKNLSTEWYIINHDLEVSEYYKLRLTASKDILMNNLKKVASLEESLRTIENYLVEHPTEESTCDMLLIVTDPSGKKVEKMYKLEEVH